MNQSGVGASMVIEDMEDMEDLGLRLVVVLNVAEDRVSGAIACRKNLFIDDGGNL